MISAQRLADTVHASVLLEMSARRAKLARQTLPLIDGHKRDAALVADIWVQDIARQLQAANHHRAYDEERVRDHAENYARLCGRMASLESRRSFGLQMGIATPQARSITPAGERQRWDDPIWWRRQLRKVWTRQSEDTLREIGVIRRGKQPYASDAAVEHRAARNARTALWMQERVMVNERGEQLELLDLHDKSLANPALRAGEIKTRIRGFQELADSLGHVALFFTLTTPSRFHAQQASGGLNPTWEDDRARVRDGQQWLCKQWARARAQLARRSILFYGVRVAEPHHDGTPHWHAMMFVPEHQAEDLRFVLRQFWLADAGDEPGAARHRIKCVTIDSAKGSAVGYMVKYISKNLDGRKEDGTDALDDAGSDEAELSGPDNAQRVAAWASVHGIRQFQQMGGPPVGLWREARRLRDPVAPILIETVRGAADAGEWCGFIQALGGIERARRRVGSIRHKYRRELRRPQVRTLKLAAKQWKTKYGPRVVWGKRPARDDEMPAMWLDKELPMREDPAGRTVLASTRYGEEANERPAGVCSFSLGRYVAADTRPHRWRIERKVSEITQRGGPSCEGARALLGKPATSGLPPRLDSFPALDSRSALGPVAITVRTVAELIEAATMAPSWKPFDAAAYQWPDSVPKYHSRAGP